MTTLLQYIKDNVSNVSVYPKFDLQLGKTPHAYWNPYRTGLWQQRGEHMYSPQTDLEEQADDIDEMLPVLNNLELQDVANWREGVKTGIMAMNVSTNHVYPHIKPTDPDPTILKDGTEIPNPNYGQPWKQTVMEMIGDEIDKLIEEEESGGWVQRASHPTAPIATVNSLVNNGQICLTGASGGPFWCPYCQWYHDKSQSVLEYKINIQFIITPPQIVALFYLLEYIKYCNSASAAATAQGAQVEAQGWQTTASNIQSIVLREILRGSTPANPLDKLVDPDYHWLKDGDTGAAAVWINAHITTLRNSKCDFFYILCHNKAPTEVDEERVYGLADQSSSNEAINEAIKSIVVADGGEEKIKKAITTLLKRKGCSDNVIEVHLQAILSRRANLQTPNERHIDAQIATIQNDVATLAIMVKNLINKGYSINEIKARLAEFQWGDDAVAQSIREYTNNLDVKHLNNIVILLDGVPDIPTIHDYVAGRKLMPADFWDPKPLPPGTLRAVKQMKAETIILYLVKHRNDTHNPTLFKQAVDVLNDCLTAQFDAYSESEAPIAAVNYFICERMYDLASTGNIESVILWMIYVVIGFRNKHQLKEWDDPLFFIYFKNMLINYIKHHLELGRKSQFMEAWQYSIMSLVENYNIWNERLFTEAMDLAVERYDSQGRRRAKRRRREELGLHDIIYGLTVFGGNTDMHNIVYHELDQGGVVRP
tara:strand:+ start:551 stop:2677 length:2127 start_codon:yes stop_codon:yes gene_type:complete